MKLIMENWRHYRIINEHGQKKFASKSSYDLAAAADRDRSGKVVSKEDIMLVLDIARNTFLKAWTGGYKRTQALKLIKKQSSVVITDITDMEVANIYDKKITPVITNYIKNLEISFNQGICQKANATFAASTLAVQFCADFLLADEFASEQIRNERLRTTLYHELTHAIDYLWSTSEIQYPGKLKGQPQTGYDFSSGLAVHQKEEIQKLFYKVLGFHKESPENAPKAAGQKPVPYTYSTDVTEVLANIQEIVLEKGAFTLKEITMICSYLSVPDPDLREDLYELGWTDQLLEDNLFIKNLECRSGFATQENVDLLNSVAKIDLNDIKQSDPSRPQIPRSGTTTGLAE